jgi:hypothetical protein
VQNASSTSCMGTGMRLHLMTTPCLRSVELVASELRTTLAMTHQIASGQHGIRERSAGTSTRHLRLQLVQNLHSLLPLARLAIDLWSSKQPTSASFKPPQRSVSAGSHQWQWRRVKRHPLRTHFGAPVVALIASSALHSPMTSDKDPTTVTGYDGTYFRRRRTSMRML